MKEDEESLLRPSNNEKNNDPIDPTNAKQEDNPHSQENTNSLLNDSISQDANDSSTNKPKRRKTINLGLDGGYWSRMSTTTDKNVEENSFEMNRRKRSRTNTERLDLTSFNASNRFNYQSNDESINSDDFSSQKSMEQSVSNSTTSNKKKNKERPILFKTKSFLAVRNESGGFFLCQATHNIYEDSKKCKIQWLEDVSPNKYKFGYVDWVDPFAIICKVSVTLVKNHYEIDENDFKKVNELLEKAIKDGGVLVELTSSSDEEKKEKNNKKVRSNYQNNKELYDQEYDSKEESDEENLKKIKSKSKKKLESSFSENESTDEDSESELDNKKKKIKTKNNNININKRTLISSSNLISKPAASSLKPTSSNNNDKNNNGDKNSSSQRKEESNNVKKTKKTVNDDDTDEVESDEEIKKKSSISKMSSITNSNKEIIKPVVNKLVNNNNNSLSKLKPSIVSKESSKINSKEKIEIHKVKPSNGTSASLQNENKSQPSLNSHNNKNNNIPTIEVDMQLNKKRKMIKAISNRFLEENTKITIYNKDPFFEDNTILIDNMPYISPYVQSKLAFKAIYLNDLEMLKNLIKDFDRCPSVHISKAVYNNTIPAEYAIIMDNRQALDILIDDYCNNNDDEKKRIGLPEFMLDKFNNGQFSQRHLGLQFVRKLTESRGSKEGNSAFLKDQSTLEFASKKHLNIYGYFRRLFQLAYEIGVSNDLFDYLISKWKSLETNKNNDSFNIFSYTNAFIYENIYRAILFGKRKLAAHVLENAPPGHGFNAIHIEVLKLDNDEDLKCQLRANMCTKKPYANDQITPIHCACINPNVKYLKTLLSITQDFNVSDKKGRRPVHFAAVCEGPIPLEYLISRVSPYEMDSMGNTPLHYACLAGRSMNVEILLSFAQSKQEDDAALTTEVLIYNKYGLGGINKPNKQGKLPLHLAISHNNYECVKILIKYGCNLEYPLPNSMGKITPMMYAAQLGHIKIVRLLKENNAKVEARDRFQRTAVIHATMCGHAKVLSYLLRLGASPNPIDSSGNSALHYACAYGWFYSMKLLLDAGANFNLYNDWKLTAFGAAFLKGHLGICDYLLQLYKNQIDINFRTDNGETLVMLSVASSSILNQSSVDQLNYVVNKLGGNCQLIDSNGNNAFHYLASNTIDETLFEQEALINKSKSQISDEQVKFRMKMAQILLKGKCNPNKENNELETPLFTAIRNFNHLFARYLLTNQEINCKIKSQQNPNGKTLLSLISENFLNVNVCHILFGNSNENENSVIASCNPIEKYQKEFELMARIRDSNDQTPFQIACLKLNEHLLKSQDDYTIPDQIINFFIFLIKNCKSNPNDLIKLQKERENSDNEEINQNKLLSSAKFVPPIFKLINDKSCNLIESLYNLYSTNQDLIKFDFNIYDEHDYLTPLLKSIALKQTKFASKLIDLNILSIEELYKQISQSDLKESILQFCIRYDQIDLFEKLIDIFIMQKSDDMKNKFYQLLMHQNKYKQNFLHLISTKTEFLNFKRLKILFTKLFDYFDDANKMGQLLCMKDKFERNPLHLCLLNHINLSQDNDLVLFLIDRIFKLNNSSIDKNKIRSFYFDQKDLFGRLPLHYLFVDKNFEKLTLNCDDVYSKYNCDDINKSECNYLYLNDTCCTTLSENSKCYDPVELLSILIEETSTSIIDDKDIYGYTALHYACIKGSTISCTSLIKNGCNILNKSHRFENTPLSSAIYFKNESLVLTLLNGSNKICLKDNYYLHPKYNSNNENNIDEILNDEPTLKCLLNDDSDDKSLYQEKSVPLFKLILENKWEGIGWLILSDLNAYGLNFFDSIELTILSSQFALTSRLIDKNFIERQQLKEFLEMITQSKSITNFDRNLLHLISLIDICKLNSSEKNHLMSILKKIFDHENYAKYSYLIDSFLTCRDSLGSTPIHYACYRHNYDFLDIVFNCITDETTIQKLLTEYKDVSNQNAYSLFFWKIGRITYSKEMKEKIVQYTHKYLLSDKHQIDQISKAYYPNFELSQPNFLRENSVKIKSIDDYPIKQNKQQQSQQISPLIFAISNQSFDMCKFLINHLNFDVNACDSNSQISAFVYAIRTNNLNICKLLLNNDYDITKKEKTIEPSAITQSIKLNRVKNFFETFNIPVKKKKTNDDDERLTSDDSIDELEEVDDNDNNDILIEFNKQKEVEETNMSNNKQLTDFKFKSNIKLNAIDKQQKTLFHHLACPLNYGSFYNIEICRLLFQAFNSEPFKPHLPQLSDFLKRIDSNVTTAADYAIKNGNIELYEEYMKALQRSVELDSTKLERFFVNDQFYLGLAAKPNYLIDSELFLKSFDSNNTESNNKFQKVFISKDSNYFQVDPLSNMNNIGCLVWEEKSNVPYDVLLTKTDVSYGLYGMHNFYKIQLITHNFHEDQNSPSKSFDHSQMCVLFTRWGRIGDKGQFQRTPFSNFKEAKDEFCKIFKQKTGNDFIETVIESKRSFESKPRRYNLIKFELRCRPKLKDIDFDLFDENNKEDLLKLFNKSKFASNKNSSDYLQFWLDLLDVNYLKNTINTKTKLSANYLPLTQLSTESIMRASEILNYKLKPMIEKRMELEKLSKKEKLIEYMNLLDEINRYSNDYYELIPQMNYNYEKLVPISNERELDAQLCTINQLNNAQIACRILMGAKHSLISNQRNPFDYVYNSINCKLELIDPNSKEAQYILRYTWPYNNKQTKNPFKIKRIFKFDRPGEQDRFEKVKLPNGSSKLKNRLLLWHGTSTENLISIMSKGLVKAPHDAKWTGHRFGKGIYFSDSFESSNMYSNGRKQLKIASNKEKLIVNRNYMLLCEVALGKIKELRTTYETIDYLPSGYDSVKALGRKESDPNNDVTLPNGCVIPLGEKIDCKLKPGESMSSRMSDHSQYVVYNESQVCIRYIVQYYLDEKK